MFARILNSLHQNVRDSIAGKIRPDTPLVPVKPRKGPNQRPNYKLSFNINKFQYKV